MSSKFSLSARGGKRFKGSKLDPFRWEKNLIRACKVSDFTCPDTLTTSQLSESSFVALSAAILAESRKWMNYTESRNPSKPRLQLRIFGPSALEICADNDGRITSPAGTRAMCAQVHFCDRDWVSQSTGARWSLVPPGECNLKD
jgi:hypothetical protein